VSRCVGVVVGAIVFAVGAFSHAPAAPVPKHLMKEPEFAHPATVGATWVYDLGSGREDTITVSKVEVKDAETLVTTEHVLKGDQRTPHMTVSVSAKGIFLVAETGSLYDAPWCMLQLPHREGQSWETKPARGGAVVVNGTMKSGPIEKVKLPTGEVTAMRVDWDLGRGQSAKFWYAHGLGLVKMEGSPNRTLKSFTPGK
jgi:hypothetical protein